MPYVQLHSIKIAVNSYVQDHIFFDLLRLYLKRTKLKSFNFKLLYKVTHLIEDSVVGILLTPLS